MKKGFLAGILALLLAFGLFFSAAGCTSTDFWDGFADGYNASRGR